MKQKNGNSRAGKKGMDFQVSSMKIHNYDGYQANTAAYDYYFDTDILSRVGILVLPLCNFPRFQLFQLQHKDNFSSNHSRKVWEGLFVDLVDGCLGFLINSGRTVTTTFFKSFSFSENVFAQS